MKRNVARLGLSAAASATSLFLAQPSQAQTFYAKGEVSIAAERVFGIHYTHDDLDGPGPLDNASSATSIGFGWNDAFSPFHRARVAVDGFIIDRLSLGGSLGFFTQTGDADGDGLLFAPRVGYAVPLSRVFTFWPRGGVSFAKINDWSLFGLSFEAMFVASPNPHWGILFGPTLDFAFVGDRGNDVDWSEIALGLPTVGLMATF